MELHSLGHLFLGDILDGGHSAFGLPGVFLHQQHVDEGIETGTGLDGILNLNALAAVDLLHVGDDAVEIALIAVELVDKEDHGLAELLRVTEVVLRAYLRTILAIDEYHCLVGDIEGGDGTSHKIVATRTVDDVELLVIPLGMKNRREHRITIFLLYGEIITDGVFRFYGTAALDDAGLEKH